MDEPVSIEQSAVKIADELEKLQKQVMKAAIIGVILAVLIVGGIATYAIKQQQAADRALACYILPQLDRAETTLPSLDYYKSHPEELRDQLAIIAQQREQTINTWGTCPIVEEVPA